MSTSSGSLFLLLSHNNTDEIIITVVRTSRKLTTLTIIIMYVLMAILSPCGPSHVSSDTVEPMQGGREGVVVGMVGREVDGVGVVVGMVGREVDGVGVVVGMVGREVIAVGGRYIDAAYNVTCYINYPCYIPA